MYQCYFYQNLDDGLGYAENLAEAKYHSHVVKSDLINTVFVPNVQKSISYIYGSQFRKQNG